MWKLDIFLTQETLGTEESTTTDYTTTTEPTTTMNPRTTTGPTTTMDPSTTADPTTTIDSTTTMDPSTTTYLTTATDYTNTQVSTEHWALSTENWALSTEHWALSTKHWALSTASLRKLTNLWDRRKIRLIEGTSKCHHLKYWPVKGLCGRCLSVWGPEPHTPPLTHCLRVYTGKGGERGELNQREGKGGNSSQSWVENTNMIDCISSL